MNYSLGYSKEVKKFLQKHHDLAPKVISALEQIAQNPYSNTQDIKRLQDTQNCYRLRIGKYRILYEIREKEILIYAYDTDSRGGIYK
ncbi:type II toxin-antitoxin system RelE/ParE family toxin [Helicobacter sp.]|uniref:type II toxin-antitoxin system RelE family toxin n=1 Tax=Helicobacter sp. TaxID=218 RepID=UPI0019A35C60|nr:type II toxin-antitoxin system RelE/ParE family toxin [Helicobacter sp.]MBD5164420.1 type II toxin-antitoxin system RelE/ParE family toxin [Helicobacter sp.]